MIIVESGKPRVETEHVEVEGKYTPISWTMSAEI